MIKQKFANVFTYAKIATKTQKKTDFDSVFAKFSYFCAFLLKFDFFIKFIFSNLTGDKLVIFCQAEK